MTLKIDATKNLSDQEEQYLQSFVSFERPKREGNYLNEDASGLFLIYGDNLSNVRKAQSIFNFVHEDGIASSKRRLVYWWTNKLMPEEFKGNSGIHVESMKGFEKLVDKNERSIVFIIPEIRTGEELQLACEAIKKDYLVFLGVETQTVEGALSFFATVKPELKLPVIGSLSSKSEETRKAQ